MPIPALVVRAHDLEPAALQERDAAQHLLTEHRVRLHHAPFRSRQRARLLEDAVWDPDLADVVEHEAVGDALIVREGRSHDAGELGRVAVDALRVLAGACVLGIERTRQRAHGLAVRALEQAPLPALELQKVTQVAGVEEQLLIREALSGRAVRGAVQSARQALDHREQLERAERLQHEGIRTDLARNRLVRLVGARQEDDRDVARRWRPLEDGAERHAVLTRHAHIEHDRVGTR